jgi:hypothetical protein
MTHCANCGAGPAAHEITLPARGAALFFCDSCAAMVNNYATLRKKQHVEHDRIVKEIQRRWDRGHGNIAQEHTRFVQRKKA